jgi:hypothetical protein
MIDDARMSSGGVALQLAARRGSHEPLGVLPSSPARGSALHARFRQETWSLARRFGCGERTRCFCSTARAARTVVIADVTALSEDDASPLGQGSAVRTTVRKRFPPKEAADPPDARLLLSALRDRSGWCVVQCR